MCVNVDQCVDRFILGTCWLWKLVPWTARFQQVLCLELLFAIVIFYVRWRLALVFIGWCELPYCCRWLIITIWNLMTIFSRPCLFFCPIRSMWKRAICRLIAFVCRPRVFFCFLWRPFVWFALLRRSGDLLFLIFLWYWGRYHRSLLQLCADVIEIMKKSSEK